MRAAANYGVGFLFELDLALAGESRSNESRKRPVHAGFADSNFLHTLKYTPTQESIFHYREFRYRLIEQ